MSLTDDMSFTHHIHSLIHSSHVIHSSNDHMSLTDHMSFTHHIHALIHWSHVIHSSNDHMSSTDHMPLNHHIHSLIHWSHVIHSCMSFTHHTSSTEDMPSTDDMPSTVQWCKMMRKRWKNMQINETYIKKCANEIEGLWAPKPLIFLRNLHVQACDNRSKKLQNSAQKPSKKHQTTRRKMKTNMKTTSKSDDEKRTVFHSMLYREYTFSWGK